MFQMSIIVSHGRVHITMHVRTSGDSARLARIAGDGRREALREPGGVKSAAALFITRFHSAEFPFRSTLVLDVAYPTCMTSHRQQLRHAYPIALVRVSMGRRVDGSMGPWLWRSVGPPPPPFHRVSLSFEYLPTIHCHFLLLFLFLFLLLLLLLLLFFFFFFFFFFFLHWNTDKRF